MPDLIGEPPGGPDTLLDVLDEAVTGLQPGVVIQRGPDLATHLLQQKQHVSGEYKMIRKNQSCIDAYCIYNNDTKLLQTSDKSLHI